MKKIFIPLFLIFSAWIFSLAGCATPPKNSQAGAAWYNNMHRLSSDMSVLTPIFSNRTAFFDPRNKNLILEKTRDLLDASLQLTKDSSVPDADPIIVFTANRFHQEIRSIAEDLNRDNLSSAQFGLSNLSNYCISCHSRADRGTKDFPLRWQSNFASLGPLQKAQFMLANRQYSSAHKEVALIAANADLVTREPGEWQTVVRKGLAVIIRVNKNLDMAISLIVKALGNKGLPYYVRYDVLGWQKSIAEWKREPNSAAKLSPKASLEKVSMLLRKAERPPYNRGQAGLIIYLRASGILHQLLENSNSAQYGEALYYAGVTAEALKDLNFWSLSETYYETCIETSPNSFLSQKCFARLERVIQQSHSYTGQLPEAAKLTELRLSRLRTMSRREPKEPFNQGKTDQEILDQFFDKDDH